MMTESLYRRFVSSLNIAPHANWLAEQKQNHPTPTDMKRENTLIGDVLVCVFQYSCRL